MRFELVKGGFELGIDSGYSGHKTRQLPDECSLGPLLGGVGKDPRTHISLLSTKRVAQK